MVKKTVKGDALEYSAWVPEYTAKTGKLTKRSKEQLEEIRAQVILENIADTDLTDLKEIGGFVGLTACFYYGVNPLLIKIIASAMDVVEVFSEYFEYSFEFLTDPFASAETFSAPYYHEQILKYGWDFTKWDIILTKTENLYIKAENQKQAERVVYALRKGAETAKTQDLAGLRKELVRQQARLETVTKIRDEAERPTPGMIMSVNSTQESIDLLNARIAYLESRIPTEAEKNWIEAKLRTYNIFIAMGEAWAAECFFKSYEAHKARQDTKVL